MFGADGRVDILQADNIMAFAEIGANTRVEKTKFFSGLTSSLAGRIFQSDIQDENESSDLLLELTFDRGDMMEKLRLSMINNTYVDTAQRQSVFISSGIFERIVWLIRKITLSRYS